VCGAVGLIGCFVPLYSPGDGPPVSWWELRDGLAFTVYSVIAAYALATLVGLAGNRMGRREAAIAAGAFAFIVYRFVTLLRLASIPFPHAGAFMMLFGVIGGLLASIVTTATGGGPRPERV
jgi:hypothetical protein